MRTSSFALAAAILAVAGSTPLAAQGLVELPEHSRRQILVGGGLTLAVPTGEFGDFVDFGGGLHGFGVFNFDREGTVGLRLDGSALWYGSETVRVPLSSFTRRVMIDVTTENLITSLGVGPQLTLGNGPIRPYVYGLVGFSYFATVSRASGSADVDDFASTTNFDDLTFSATAGAGFMIQVSGGRTPVWIDLSGFAVQNGRTRYLREGSIQERSDGSLFITPIESETNMLAFRLGVTAGVF